MNCRIGYLEEDGYAAEGNVIRHGDVLHDMEVDFDKNIRVLGMIGMFDIEVTQSDLLNGDAALAYVILIVNDKIQMSPVLYNDEFSNVYGLDPNALNIRQVIRVERMGMSAMSVIKVVGGGAN